MFRSWLLPGLLELGLHPAPGLVLSALFFGGLHAYTPLYMLLASVAGFLLGAMFLATGSVLHPATVHFLYDFATILVMQRRWRGPSSASSE